MVFSPPSKSINSIKYLLFKWYSTSFNILFEFPSPKWISAPECPPSKPFTSIEKTVSSFSQSFLIRLNSFSILAPPALLTYTCPYSSVSRLIKAFPEKRLKSKLFTPVIPSSSSVVRITSSAGWAISSLSKIARAIATAIPLSAPNVVPFAVKNPSFTASSIPQFSKSKSVFLFFSQTISICPCKIRGEKFS